MAQIEIADPLYQAEKLTREYAARLGPSLIDDRILKEFDRIRDFITRDFADTLSERVDKYSELGSERVESLTGLVGDIDVVLTHISRDLDRCFEIEEGNTCRSSSEAVDALRRVEDRVVEATGQKCIITTRSVAEVINSLSSCIHRVADFLAETKAVSKRCNVSEKSNPNNALVEACKAWDELVDKLNELRLYAPEDVIPLQGIIVDDELMMRVGSAAGHATHIDLEKGTLEYYDRDENVNIAMQNYFERYAGLDCVTSANGVNCKGVNKDNVKKVTKILAFATSKDFRLDNPESYYLGNERLTRFLSEHGIEVPIPKEQIQEVRNALKEYIAAVEEAIKEAPTRFKPRLEELAKEVDDVLKEVNKKIEELRPLVSR